MLKLPLPGMRQLQRALGTTPVAPSSTIPVSAQDTLRIAKQILAIGIRLKSQALAVNRRLHNFIIKAKNRENDHGIFKRERIEFEIAKALPADIFQIAWLNREIPAQRDKILALIRQMTPEGLTDILLHPGRFTCPNRESQKAKAEILMVYVEQGKIFELFAFLAGRAKAEEAYNLQLETAALLVNKGVCANLSLKILEQAVAAGENINGSQSLVYLIDVVQKLIPQLLSAETLAMIVSDCEASGPEGEKLLIAAGMLFPDKALAKVRKKSSFPAKILLSLGELCYESCVHREQISQKLSKFYAALDPAAPKAAEDMLAQFGEVSFPQERVVAGARLHDTMWGVREERSALLATAEDILKKKSSSPSDYAVLRAFLTKDAKLTSGLDLKLENADDQLLPELTRAYFKDPKIVNFFHLLRTEGDLREINELLSKDTDPAAIIQRFAREADGQKKRWLLQIIKLRLAESADNYPLANKLASLLNDPSTPAEIVPDLVEIGIGAVKQRLPYLLEGGVDPLAVPDKVRDIAREVAGQAHKCLRSIREITARTKKPTFTFYILTTAAGFNAEAARPFDAYSTNPALREAAYRRIVEARLGWIDPAEIALIERVADPAAKANLQIVLIGKVFDRSVEALRKQGVSQDTDILKMMVAGRWIRAGSLDRYTCPVQFKIPSGSPPSEEAVKRVAELTRAARQNNWDIIFIDHSTVRTQTAVHPQDPPEFEKGRALARAFKIVRETLGGSANTGWLFQLNRWRTRDLTLLPDAPNFVALNLYHGKVYEQRVDGAWRKPDWAPIDDHRTIFFARGRSQPLPAVQAEEKKFDPRDGFAIERQADGKFVYHQLVHLYWEAFEKRIRRLELAREALTFRRRHILVACNANHHRSRLAEATLPDALYQEYGEAGEQVTISSAGLDVNNWKRDNPTRPAVSARVKKLLEGNGHRVPEAPKRQIDPGMVDAADLIIVMTRRELAELLRRFPQAQGKAFLLKELAGFPPEERDLPTPKEFDDALLKSFEEIARKIARLIPEPFQPPKES